MQCLPPIALYCHMAELELYKRPGGTGPLVEEALLFRQAIAKRCAGEMR